MFAREPIMPGRSGLLENMLMARAERENMRRQLTALGLACAMLAGTAAAQAPEGPATHVGHGPTGHVGAPHHHGEPHHDGMGQSAPTDTPATSALRQAQAAMHHDMAIRYSNDVDVDFVRGMIPHHQGAIDMAKIALQYSRDPEIRKLAEDIVKAQQAEIAQMEAFLQRRQTTK